MKTYKVYQSFESLGDPNYQTFTRKRDAERAAERLRNQIAKWVAEMDTPDVQEISCAGYIHETEAWDQAQEIAGVEYENDDPWRRTAKSPATYGIEAGRHIAEAAVKIDVIEE